MIEIAPGQMAGVQQIMGFVDTQAEFVAQKQTKDGHQGQKEPEQRSVCCLGEFLGVRWHVYRPEVSGVSVQVSAVIKCQITNHK